jgi:hypothetical protein
MLFDSTPAEFRSAFGLDESVERLRAATRRSAFASAGETAAVGKVSESGVRLRRVRPMLRNSFQPIFVGRFEQRGIGVVLQGKFTMSPFVKVFMTFWFGMVGLFALASLISGFNPRGPHATFFRLQPFLMICFGIALVAACRWLARNDAQWLSGVIGEALGDARAQAMRGGADSTVTDESVVLRIAATLLAVSGLISLLIGMLAPPIAMLPPVWSRSFGAASIVLAFGVWRGRLWAWWGGFALLAFSSLASWLALPVGLGSPQPPLRAGFALFAALITAVWARWWYAQRKHFH